MKKRYWLMGATAICFMACNKDSDVVPIPVVKTDTLTQNILADVTLDANTSYLVDGQLYVKNNATLTIPAGTTVSFAKKDVAADKSSLVITQGAKLIVNGTADKPVVFTSAATTKSPGGLGCSDFCWVRRQPTRGTGNVEGLAVTDDAKYGGYRCG